MLIPRPLLCFLCCLFTWRARVTDCSHLLARSACPQAARCLGRAALHRTWVPSDLSWAGTQPLRASLPFLPKKIQTMVSACPCRFSGVHASVYSSPSRHCPQEADSHCRQQLAFNPKRRYWCPGKRAGPAWAESALKSRVGHPQASAKQGVTGDANLV